MMTISRDELEPPMIELTITRLVDELVEAEGHHVTSRYCEVFWLPVLGPTSLWLLRNASYHTHAGPYVVDAEVLGKCLGVGGGAGRHSVLTKSLNRLVAFGCARGWSTDWQLRTHLATLQPPRLVRLPETLRGAHEVFLARAKA